MNNLKEQTLRGGFSRLCAQGANFAVRVVSLMVLARLLAPADFGLVGMVTAFTGVLSLFRDFGLSSAAVQRTTVTDEQVSTLFWINVLVGALLGLVSLAAAPLIVALYHEPRLFNVTAALALGFVFNAVGVQHGAVLQRQMRFTALAVVNTVALIASTALGIVLAVIGYGYWALVVATVVSPLAVTIGVWLAVRWIPGLPRRRSGIRSMVRFGGTMTLNGLVVYAASNAEKVLLGRFWGADVLGLYGRAYQLINIPTDNLNSAAGEVAFAALARLQHDPARLRNYFLKGYSLILSFTLPLTFACALFADDVIAVLLGPRWKDAAIIFRLLAPTILVFAVVNPLGWLLNALGLVGRSLKMGLAVAPFMIAAYLLGLPYGPTGVAFAYSAVMLLWIVPAIAWALHGTVISPRDMLATVVAPLGSTIASGGLAAAVGVAWCQSLSPFPRLAIECCVGLVTYLGVLLFVAGQKGFYMDLLRSFRRGRSVEGEGLASA